MSEYATTGRRWILENNESTINTDVNTNGFQEGLNKLKNIANAGIKDIAKDIMGNLSSICSVVMEQITDVVKENLSSDISVLNSALEGTGMAIYKEIKNPMQETFQEITGYVNELTNKIAYGELGESFEKIAVVISNVASSLASVAIDNVLPALINSLSWVIDNGYVFVSVMAGATAAVATYSAVTAAATVTLSSLGSAIVKIGSAIANSLLAINPLVLGLSIITATVVGMSVALKMAADNMNIAAAVDPWYEMAQKNVSAIREEEQAIKDLIKTANEKISVDEIETNNIQNLWNELQDYVDASGNVIKNGERVSEIIGTLNNAYGMNIECINGQIQGYKNLAGSMDDYIANLRLESKARNMQPVYDEAIQKQEEYNNRRLELEKQLNDKILAFQTTDNNDVKGVFAVQIGALREEILALDESAEIYAEAIREFEGLFTSHIDTQSMKTSAQMNAEDYARKSAESMQEYGKKQEANTQKMQAEWEKLNHQYAIGEIESEEKLYEKKLEVWEKYGNKNNKDHWSYYEELYKYEQDSAEKRKQTIENTEKEIAETQKQEMREKWDTISKLENLGLISSEEAYKRQLALIEEYCPEYSDEWYSYYQTVTEYQRNALKKQVQSVRDNISDIVSEYQEAFAELENSVNSYKNKLLSVEPLFTIKTETDDDGNETTTYTVENLTEQMDKMQKYHNLIMDLKERGVSNEVLSELTTLDFDDGMIFAENLSKSSDAELEHLSELYAQKEQLAEDLANELYAPEMDKLNTDLIDSVIGQFGTLPEEIRAIGAQSLASFTEGILEDKENLTEAAHEFMNSFFTACDEGISSGSIGMENVGDNITSILEEQDLYAVGLEKGSEFASGMKDAFALLEDKLMLAQANVSADLTVGTAAQSSYGGSSWSGSGKEERIVIENRDKITVKVDRDVLGKTVNEWTKEYKRRTGT